MLVMVNVDDVVGESVPYIIEKLMDLGAEGVHAIPTITKKGRPGFVFLIDTVRENVDAIGEFLVREVGTLGLRLFQEVEHIKFNYEIKETRLVLKNTNLVLPLSVKIVRDRQGAVASIKAEYKDLKAAADALSRAGARTSLIALKEMVEAAILSGESRTYRGLKVELEGCHKASWRG